MFGQLTKEKIDHRSILRHTVEDDFATTVTTKWKPGFRSAVFYILFLALPPQIQFLCLLYEEIFVLGLFCLTLYTGRKQSVVVSIHMLQGLRV